MEQYRYFAFISYSSKDISWGKRLHRKLESFMLPTAVCKVQGLPRKPMCPVFFAPTDIQPGGLDEELQNRLQQSANLIVICSPNSAQSKWVGKEIEYFYNLGRKDKIHFFIVDGTPNSNNPATDCFNPIVEKIGLPEILGANVHEHISQWGYVNREHAYIQLISKMLGLEFDTLWNRQQRRLRNKAIGYTLSLAAIAGLTAYAGNYYRPTDIQLRLQQTSDNVNLPPLQDAIVSITIHNETKTDTIHSAEDTAQFLNIPRAMIGERAAVKVECKDFLPVDTTITLNKEISIAINRNPEIYGNIKIRLWDIHNETTVNNQSITIDGKDVTSDNNGIVTLQIPLAQQRTIYKVIINGKTDSIVMPTGDSDNLIID